MSKTSKYVLFLLRISMGGIFFYAGLTKVLNPEWTSLGYISNSKILPGLYSWLGSIQNIGWVDMANKWGLLLIGISLILGLLVRFSSSLGALMMLLYYLPILDFPYAGEHSYIIDDHIIYILVLIFATVGAGRFVGLDNTIRKKRLNK